MGEYLIWFTAAAATTAGGVALTRAHYRQRKKLARAFFELMECVGLFVLFLALNMALAAGLILLFRAASDNFISLYIVGDVAIVLVSAFQGLLFRLWWRAG